MSEFIARRAERQFSDSDRPARPSRVGTARDTISRHREQSAAGETKPESRGYQMGEPMKETQQG